MLFTTKITLADEQLTKFKIILKLGIQFFFQHQKLIREFQQKKSAMNA